MTKLETLERARRRTSPFVIFHVVLTGALACPLSLPGVLVTSCGVCDIYGKGVMQIADDALPAVADKRAVTDYERDPRD